MSRRLKFGVALPQGWLDDLPVCSPSDQFEYASFIAKIADENGYHGIYAYDHFIPHFAYDIKKNFFECFTLLSALAPLTKSVKLGQIVTCNSYRNPSLLAKISSTIDIISKGRLEFGIGAGWYEDEYKSYGYQFPSDITRISQLEESIQIIKSMWTEQFSTFHGSAYSVNDAICNPKPMQKPNPEIMVGGSGERYLLKVAAKYADIYNNPFGDPQTVERKIKVLKEHCENIKRDFQDIEKSVLIRSIIKESEEDLGAQLEELKPKNQTRDQFLNKINSKGIAGTPENVIKKIDQYIQIGVTHFIIHFHGLDKPTLELFKSKVIDRL